MTNISGGFVTMEVSCRTYPDLWGVWVGNHPDLPGRSTGRPRLDPSRPWLAGTLRPFQADLSVEKPGIAQERDSLDPVPLPPLK